MSNKPAVCRHLGCVGTCCKYRKSKEEYPYFDCTYPDGKETDYESEGENENER
jgi:hypothetical protein